MNVTVEADPDGDGSYERRSDVLSVSDGASSVPVTGLSGQSRRYRLVVEPATDDRRATPTLTGLELVG